MALSVSEASEDLRTTAGLHALRNIVKPHPETRMLYLCLWGYYDVLVDLGCVFNTIYINQETLKEELQFRSYPSSS